MYLWMKLSNSKDGHALYKFQVVFLIISFCKKAEEHLNDWSEKHGRIMKTGITNPILHSINQSL